MFWRHLLVVLTLSATGLAEESKLPTPQVLTYPPGDDKIAVVRKGEVAPYTGQLFEDNTALRWAVWLQQYRTRYGLDLRAAQEGCAVRLDHASALAAIEATRTQQIEKDLRARLTEVDAQRLRLEETIRDPGFFKQPGTWVAVGVVTTLATVFVTAYAVHEVK